MAEHMKLRDVSMPDRRPEGKVKASCWFRGIGGGFVIGGVAVGVTDGKSSLGGEHLWVKSICQEI
jgi:hypothetical protein